ncbi:PTS transporter subunit IIC [Deinococcus lacus]|uniref:PTS transporter subunit IIC n=1 Tax=Deinococcus lacus TaxID=392561 RepID=A0ABW1YCN2_9DEIO
MTEPQPSVHPAPPVAAVPPRLSAGQFTMNVLNGTAIGVVAGLIPNAILGELFKYLATLNPVFTAGHQVVAAMQFTVPVLIGVLVGMQFRLTPIQTVVVGAAAFVSSGIAKFTEQGVMLAGIGDLINTMLTAAAAVLLIRWIGNRLGALNILALPVLAGAGAGLFGLLTLPWVRLVTSSLGELILTFTTLQPLAMAALIGAFFAMLIVSPISTVGLATAVGLSGLASGAANMGVSATFALLAVAMWRVNPIGPPLAVLLGTAKMMMPNVARKPRLLIPLALNGLLAGVAAALLGIQGTPFSAGFGSSGLVGPVNSYGLMEGDTPGRLIRLVTAYLIVPFLGAFLLHPLMLRLGVYEPQDLRFDP